jgi:hypothetical protein
VLPIVCYSYELIGCYNDHLALNERDMSAALFLDDKLTPDMCEVKCGSARYAYFGLQYGNECWCNNEYGQYGQADDPTTCHMQCAGDANQHCGGPLRLLVHKVTKNCNHFAPRFEPVLKFF